MKVIVLASGSKGNATYIETNNTKILIDAGISYSQIKQRLSASGIFLNKLDALFVTHEHTDHIKHLIPVLEKTQAKLFINQKSYERLDAGTRTNLIGYNITFIEADHKYTVNKMIVVPMQLYHDAANTFGYLIKDGQNTIGYVTDTGYVDPKYWSLLSHMQVLVMEANHNVEMLLNSNRPWLLKQRILSNHGHLSNEECYDVLSRIISDETCSIIFAHLSEECNTEDAVWTSMEPLLSKHRIKFYIAKQHIPTDIEVAA